MPEAARDLFSCWQRRLRFLMSFALSDVDHDLWPWLCAVGSLFALSLWHDGESAVSFGNAEVGVYRKGADPMNSVADSLIESNILNSEEFFQRMIILERKKTERSGRSFLLVFLDVGPLLRDSGRPQEILLDSLSHALNSSTRDIDVKGWYRKDSLIGVLCTDVRKGDSASVVDKIKGKLKSAFSPDEAKKIKMFVLHYPDLENRLAGASPAQVIRELRPERKGVFFS